MFCFKNNRLHCEGVSIKIPEGAYLDFSESHFNSNAVIFRTALTDISVKISLSDEGKCADTLMTDKYRYTNVQYSVVPTVLPNGFRGYHSYHHNTDFDIFVYDARFDLPNGKVFCIYIVSDDTFSETIAAAIVEEIDFQYSGEPMDLTPN